jgi:hypothetical protein
VKGTASNRQPHFQRLETAVSFDERFLATDNGSYPNGVSTLDISTGNNVNIDQKLK